MPNLRMRLAIHVSLPSLAGGTANALACQTWVGGSVDRATRSMIADPGRWLSLVETETSTAAAAAGYEGALLDWDLVQINPGDRPTPKGAGGLVLTSMDVEEAVEDEFNEWYDTEHIPLLSKLPGMLAARRFRAQRGSPRYVALYHVTDIAIYAKPSWYSANETPWMLRMRRFQRNRTYFMFRSAEGTPQ